MTIKAVRKVAPADLVQLREVAIRLIDEECGIRPAARRLGRIEYAPQLSHMRNDPAYIPSVDLARQLRVFARTWTDGGSKWLRVAQGGVWSVYDLPNGTVVLSQPFECPGCIEEKRPAWYVGYPRQKYCPDHGWSTPQGRRYQRQRRR